LWDVKRAYKRVTCEVKMEGEWWNRTVGIIKVPVEGMPDGIFVSLFFVSFQTKRGKKTRETGQVILKTKVAGRNMSGCAHKRTRQR
jgi:hypothetical protein